MDEVVAGLDGARDAALDGRERLGVQEPAFAQSSTSGGRRLTDANAVTVIS